MALTVRVKEHLSMIPEKHHNRCFVLPLVCSLKASMDFFEVLGPLGGPMVHPKCAPNRPLSNETIKLYRCSFGFTTNVKTCAIMEREARNVQEKQYAGKRKE